MRSIFGERQGYLYGQGLGVTQDYQVAKQWYEKAAAAEDAGAMDSLGVLYENGYGVPQSYQKAKEWYEKAAAAGNVDAQRRLRTLPNK